jgi:hypothetical protein
MRKATRDQGSLDIAEYSEVVTDGYDRMFALASRFGRLWSSQWFTVNYITNYHKLGEGELRRHDGFCCAVT